MGRGAQSGRPGPFGRHDGAVGVFRCNSVMRKLCLFLVIVVGAFWIVGAFALEYPAKTQAVDDLTGALRPAFTDAGITQANSDLATATTFASDFQTKAVPALAQQLGITPDDFVTTVAMEYSVVGAGLQQLPEILRYFDGVRQTMAAQQPNFEQADAIPTRGLPNSTVHWLFVALGLGAVAIGVAGLATRGSTLPSAAAVLGVGVIATTLLLSVPAKTSAVDELTAAFRPVFTEQGAAQARAYVDTLEAMQQQLTTEALPAMAAMLDVTPDQLTATLAADAPTVAAGLQQLPAILARIDALVTTVEANLHNFELADSMPTRGLPATAVTWQLGLPAGVLIVAGAAAAITTDRRRNVDPGEIAPSEPALAA